MSRAKSSEGMPYLYNPRNGRVMVATEAKLARLDRYDKPYFIPCMLPTGPDGSNVSVSKGSDAAKPQIEEFSKPEEEKVEVSTTTDLLNIVMASEDKDELIRIGSDIGIKLTKNMKVETMQKRISAKLKEL